MAHSRLRRLGSLIGSLIAAGVAIALLALAPWPQWDPLLADDDERILPVQINGKRRGEVRAPAGASAGEVEKLVFENEEIAKRLEGVTVRKVIVVPDRIVNLVVA